MASTLTCLGVLLMGGVIGVLVALPLRASKSLPLRVVAAAVGILFGGVPLAFTERIAQLAHLGQEVWLYPIGLAGGLILFRVREAIIILGSPKQARSDHRQDRLRALVDVCGFALIAATAVFVLALPYARDALYLENAGFYQHEFNKQGEWERYTAVADRPKIFWVAAQATAREEATVHAIRLGGRPPIRDFFVGNAADPSVKQYVLAAGESKRLSVAISKSEWSSYVQLLAARTVMEFLDENGQVIGAIKLPKLDMVASSEVPVQ